MKLLIKFISALSVCLCNALWSQENDLLRIIERNQEMHSSKQELLQESLCNLKQEEVSYQNHRAGVTLSGTLTMPVEKEPIATVVLVAGYGKHDRDYTMMAHKRFLVIAEYLTHQGFAVLRFDKRGVGSSTGSYAEATSRDFADDVIAGIEYLKTRRDIDPAKIGLLGHSEGGMISCMVAAEISDVAYIVLMAGQIHRNIEDLVIQTGKQLKADGASDELLALDKDIRTKIFTVVQQEDSGKSACKKVQELMGDYCQQLPQHIQEESNNIAFAITEKKAAVLAHVFCSPWYRYFVRCNVIDFLKNIHVPVLALYGDRDWITSPEPSLSLLCDTLRQAGNGDCTALVMPGLNHSCQTCITGSMAEYATIQETIAPCALHAITNWLLDNINK